MSTSVAMPVRVKPPPAEMGDTISPRCASFETTTPANGARTMQLSRSCFAIAILASDAPTCSRARVTRALKLSTVVRTVSSCCSAMSPRLKRSSLRLSSRSALARLTRRSPSAAAVASRSATAEASRTLASESSRRARICPASTRLPSSAKISLTRAVIFAATVARRRGVTYPLALSSAGRAPLSARTAATCTSGVCSRKKPYSATASRGSATSAAMSRRRWPRGAARRARSSIFRAERSGRSGIAS